MELRKGDVFTTNEKLFMFASLLNNSTYNHTGVIIGDQGETFESLWMIGRYHISRYAGRTMLIARPKHFTDDRFQKGWGTIKKYEGGVFPVQRLFLYMFNLARYIHCDWDYPVCSELAAKFLGEAGFRNGCDCWGVTPDELAKEWQSSPHYDIVFNGTLPHPPSSSG